MRKKFQIKIKLGKNSFLLKISLLFKEMFRFDTVIPKNKKKKLNKSSTFLKIMSLKLKILTNSKSTALVSG